MQKFEIKGKVVLVTGASSGVGQAVSIRFAKGGAKVALVGRNQVALERSVKEIEKFSQEKSGTAKSFICDLNEISSISQLVNTVREEMGPIDILINSAAYAVGGLVEDCPIDQYRKNLEVNFFAPLALIQAVLPDMKQKGSGQIINVTSGVGTRALPGFSSYCVTKFALNGLTESLRLELKPFGIDVILISPGRVASKFHDRTEFYGRLKMVLPPLQIRSAEEVAERIFNASRKRLREVALWGPGVIGSHLNYWTPKLLDWILAKKFPVG